MFKTNQIIILLVCTVLHFDLGGTEEISKTCVKSTCVQLKNNTNVSNVSIKSTEFLTEGGKISVDVNKSEVKEGVHNISSPITTNIEKNLINTTTSSTNHQNVIQNNSSNDNVKPVTEKIEVVGDSKIKPRKGVTFNEQVTASTIRTENVTISKSVNLTTSTLNTNGTTPSATSFKPSTVTSKPSTQNSTVSTTISTTTNSTVFIPHKPKVTIGSDDDELSKKSIPKVFVNGKEIPPKKETASPDIINNDHVIISGKRVEKGPDYVLPIVLTILAVPLLAIILSVVYKRGSEWWQHRHYRRMDFLIDGMYNN